MANIKFWLDGCDIRFLAEAPEDMTVKELVEQCDRIKPDWCACGLKSFVRTSGYCFDETEIIFSKDDVKKTSEDVSCTIYPNGDWYKDKMKSLP